MIPKDRIRTEHHVVCDLCGHKKSDMDITRTLFQKRLSMLKYKMREGKVICPTCFKKMKK